MGIPDCMAGIACIGSAVAASAMVGISVSVADASTKSGKSASAGGTDGGIKLVLSALMIVVSFGEALLVDSRIFVGPDSVEASFAGANYGVSASSLSMKPASELVPTKFAATRAYWTAPTAS